MNYLHMTEGPRNTLVNVNMQLLLKGHNWLVKSRRITDERYKSNNTVIVKA